MSDEQWAEIRQRWNALGDTFRESMKQINTETEATLRRAMPSNGDTRRKRQPDPAARLHSLGEQLQARRRQQMMRALGLVTVISFLAGWLGGRVSARSLGAAPGRYKA